MEYRALLFDLGKTLLHFDFGRGYRQLEPVCPHRAADIPLRLAGNGLVERFESGLVEPREFFEQLTRTLELRIDYERFCEIWCGIFTEMLVPESLLEALAARYRLVLLSNTNAIHFPVIRRIYPALRHFHELVLSYEVKAVKPQPEIYRAAIARAGCRAEECFYTDDIPEYVTVARQMGIDAVRFENAAQLERELQARSIRW